MTAYHAVVHAHPPQTVTLSLSNDSIIPIDTGEVTFCPFMPVVEGMPGSEDLAVDVARGLLSSCVALARGRGTFSWGKNLDEVCIIPPLQNTVAGS
jgi:L-fuculose-phosphate aldolase